MATLLQAALESAALLTPAMASASAGLGALALIGAGVYQLTPFKEACLGKCRNPLQFLMTRWRPGPGGAFRMGLEHGAWCVGCCWALMLLLFVAGVMNLAWVALIAAFVFVEKVFPAARLVTLCLERRAHRLGAMDAHGNLAVRQAAPVASGHPVNLRRRRRDQAGHSRQNGLLAM